MQNASPNTPKFAPGSFPGPSWTFVAPGRSGAQREPACLGRPKAPKNDPKFAKSAPRRRNKPTKSEKHDLQKPIFTDCIFCVLFLHFFSNFYAFWKARTLIFVARSSVLTTFQKKHVFQQLLILDRFCIPKMLQNRSWETQKITKFQSGSPNIQS